MKLLSTLLSALIMIMFCIQAGACRSSGATSSAPTPPAGSYTTGLFEVAYGTTVLKASGASVSPEFFPGVSARPLLGRLFLPEEYLAGKQGVVILSHRLWQQRLGGNPSVIGTVLQIGGKSYTIVGVMPPSFEIPSGAEIWAPREQPGK